MNMNVADNQKKIGEQIINESGNAESKKERKGNREDKVEIKTGFIVFNPVIDRCSNFPKNKKNSHSILENLNY